MSAIRAATNSPAVRVLIADATSMSCQLLTFALTRSSDRIEVVDHCATGRRVLDSVARYKPSVVLLSSGIAEGPTVGSELLSRIRAIHPPVRVVVLLEDTEREQVIAAFRAGASGIFTRKDSLELLPRCLLAVSEGQIWASSNQLEYLLVCFTELAAREDSAANAKGALTQRENEVAGLVAQGLTNRAISGMLGLSQHTVKNYVFRIYEKLGVTNRVELTRQVMPSAVPRPSFHKEAAWNRQADPLAASRKMPGD